MHLSKIKMDSDTASMILLYLSLGLLHLFPSVFNGNIVLKLLCGVIYEYFNYSYINNIERLQQLPSSLLSFAFSFLLFADCGF